MSEPHDPAVEAQPSVPDASAAPAAAESVTAAPETAQQPAQTPEPAPEGAKPEGEKPAEPRPHFDEPSLLESGKKPDEKAVEKSVDKKPDEAAKPDGQQREQPQAEPFKFDAYVLPEGFKADDALIGRFNETLTKADLNPQARGQELLNMHAEAMTRYSEQVAEQQMKLFSDTRRSWRDQIKADLEMGGPSYNSTLKDAAEMRDLFVSPAHMQEFDEFCRFTGAGDHPAFTRLMRAIARRFKEPGPKTPAFTPPSDIGQKPAGRAGARQQTLYEHPRSQEARDQQRK
jgi:hypothetical protein